MTDDAAAVALTAEAAAAAAARSTAGVVRLQPGVWGLVAQLGRELWDRKAHHPDTAGVTVTVTGARITVDVCLVIDPNHRAVDVADVVQHAVAQAVRTSTGYPVDSVSAHITDIDLAALLT